MSKEVNPNVKELIEEPNRKPWIKRQQNIFTLIGIAIAAATLIFGKKVVEPIIPAIGGGVFIIGNILGESWRDSSKFKNAWEFIKEATITEENDVK